MNGQIEVAVDKPATHSPCRHQRKSLVAVPLKCYNRFLAKEKNMAYEELTDALAAKLGIEGMIREDGVCSVEIDGMIVSLVHVGDADAMALHGIVGDPPPEAEGRFGAMLLQANHMFKGTGGATLSQDPESKEYALQRQFPLALLDADSLAAELEKFVDSLERWKGVLADFRPIEEKASAMEPGEVPLSAFGSSGFMSV